MLSVILAASMLGQAVDQHSLVETLKDAQATHREEWSRGTATVRLEIRTPKSETPAVIDGDVMWLDSSFILKLKVADPEGTFFSDRAVEFSEPGNFIARGPDGVVTFASRNHVLHHREASASAFPSIFDISLLTTFTMCCPPNAPDGRLWNELIGPAPNLSPGLARSRFIHRTLPNGDVEQTRELAEGQKSIIVFGAKEGFAPTSTTFVEADGSTSSKRQYRYTSTSGRLYPSACKTELTPREPERRRTFDYTFSKVQIPGSFTPAEFSRASLLARIRREAGDPKKQPSGPNRTTDQTILDSMSRELREKGTAKP